MLWPARIRPAVFRHQGVEEPLLGSRVLDDADGAEYDHAAVGDRGVAFEAAVVEHPAGLVDLEADALVLFYIRAQMAARRRIVDQHLAIGPHIEQRHAIGPAVGADARYPTAEAMRQKFVHLLIGHYLVGAS